MNGLFYGMSGPAGAIRILLGVVAIAGVAAGCGSSGDDRGAGADGRRSAGLESAAADLAEIVGGTRRTELPVPSSENVGTVPGEASVQGGAAAYSIAIEVPPGRQGMQPAVRLDYESRAGNGIAGVGWSLVAGSSIYRCPRTVAQDGGTRSVDFGPDDRLCLDGERLVLVSGGYGQVGSDYRTEIDQFARITLLGDSTASRSSYFRVETRSGIIQYYGAGTTRDAVYSPAGAPAPLAWKLRRSQDRQGNSMEYDYGSSATGHVPREIRYTGMGATPGNRRVTFAYEEGRPDVSLRYRAGARLVSPLRLTDIRTYVGTELVRRYQLRYVHSEATGRSLLERIRVCASEACTGTDVSRWTTLSYANRGIGVDAHTLDEASGETRQVRLVNDYDGDGTRDRLVLEYPQPWGGLPIRQLLYLSSRQAPLDLSGGPWLDAYDSPLDGYPSSRDTDFDRDGIADLVGRINGRLAIASWRGDRLVHTASNLALPTSSYVAETIDMDADGDTDVRVIEGGAVIMHHNCTARGSQTIQFCGSTPITTLGREDIMQIADLDGNAMPDLYIDWNGLGEPVPPRIVFTSRVGGSLVFTSATVASLGGPGISLRELKGAGFFDANGDGLLDIYLLPDRLWLNTGGRFVAATLANTLSLNRGLYTAVFPMDIDADGHDELMVPAELVHSWCYLVDSDVEPREYCGADFLRGNAPEELDRSIYRWDAVRVRFDASGAARFERSPTPLTVPVRASRVEDFYGDGLPDVSYRIANLYGHTPVGRLALGSYSSALPAGGYVARNRGASTSASQVPDLLLMVHDGMGRAHSWSYAPLSSPGVSACRTPAASPFYRAHRDAAAPHQYHFTSSMQVVARFTEPSGAGGSNATCYRYEDAIYNDEGRGFMGFRAIIAEQANRADPENSLRTTTRYHDAFPRTGRALHVQIQLASDPASRTPLRESSQSWIPRCSGGVCFVYLAGQIERAFDLETRALLSTTTTITAYDPDDRLYGNPSAIEVITDDAFMTHVQRTVFEYDYGSVSAWWLDKVTRTTVTDQPVHYKSAPLPDAADNAAKTVVTTFRWYGARHPSERLLAAQTVQPGSPTQEQHTEYKYDVYGNLTKQRISGSGLAAPRFTRWTYGAGGYFATTETNAANHTTIMDHAAATGLVLWERSRGITTRYAYDGFGRLITTTQDGMPPIRVRRLWCDASCPPWASVRVATVQDGAPIRWHYMDELERAVKTQATGFGASVARVRDIVSIAKYDQRGHLVRESQPSEDPGGAHFTTYRHYDALGRPGRKDVDRSDLPHGVFTTRYHHAGATTQITLPGGLTASRTYDARGLLVETVDTGGHATRYRHDAHGNTILIEDSAGNRLTARHDDLGRRVALSDPDGGAWSFAYNGAGELVSQTDANGESVGFVYDVLGRVRRREVNGVVESEWIYDFTRQGMLYREQTAGGYARTYTYDDVLRPTRIVTRMDDLQFVQEYAYDRYYGHLEGIRYPSGEIRALDYDLFGYLVAERDPTRQGKIYRVIEQMSPRGQIAREVLGNGVIGSYYHYASTGQLRHTRLMHVAGSITILQDVRYDYDDPYANLTRRTNLLTGASEAFTYDALQRLERATRTWTDGRPDVEIGYAYDPLGNLTRKDDFALSYHYGDATRTNAANAGPHAVVSLVLPDGSQVNDFAYDVNGNMISGNGRQLRYSAFGKPVEIREGSTTTALWYGPDQSRYKQTRGGETIYYVDKDYERIITADGETVEKTYLGDYLVIEQTADARHVRYLHSDRMGSVDTITDDTGAVLERYGYDAFGKPLTSDWEDAGGILHSGEYPTATTTRGFTAHEHLDAHGIIHMNGRAYDPAMGRFFSVDPYIQNPRNSQSLNPYSYVLNNPLSATDPTGYQCDPSAADTAGCIDAEGNRVPQPAAADTGSNGQEGQGVDTASGEPAVNQGKPNLPETYCGGGDGCVTVPNAAKMHFQDGQVHYIFDIDESGTIRPDDGKGSFGTGRGILPIRVTLDQAKALHGAQIVLTALSGAVGAARAALGRVFRGITSRASHSGLGGIGGMLGKLRNVASGGATLSKQSQKSIRSLEKQIAKHEQKLADFKANPTVRPGMEKLPKEVIEKQQQTRIRHLEKEIHTFRDNIEKIRRGDL